LDIGPLREGIGDASAKAIDYRWDERDWMLEVIGRHTEEVRQGGHPAGHLGLECEELVEVVAAGSTFAEWRAAFRAFVTHS
jgi:hypothetical protein